MDGWMDGSIIGIFLYFSYPLIKRWTDKQFGRWPSMNCKKIYCLDFLFQTLTEETKPSADLML